jgi:hypothetical protein
MYLKPVQEVKEDDIPGADRCIEDIESGFEAGGILKLSRPIATSTINPTIHQMLRGVRFLMPLCPTYAQFAWNRTSRAKSSFGRPYALMHFTRIVLPNTWPRK